MSAQTDTPISSIAFPVLAIGFIVLAPLIGFKAGASTSPLDIALSAAMLVIMLGAIFAAVHHADVIAHRVGEPFGTLVLTLAVTIIEVALIELIVLTPNSSPALARDTVFAVIMIVCNGLVGLCVLVGGLRHHEQEFQVSGASVYVHLLGALSVLTLVLPNYTQTIVGPYFSNGQLVFVSVITVILYATFLFIQTSRHTDYFRAADKTAPDGQHIYPSNKAVAISAIALLAALGGVILLAKKFAVLLEAGSAQRRRAGRGGRHRHRHGGPGAGKHQRGARSAQRRAAEEPQSRARLVARDHRAHHSGGGADQYRDRQADPDRHLVARHAFAGADIVPERADLRLRPHQYSRRPRASRRLRHVHFSGFRAVTVSR